MVTGLVLMPARISLLSTMHLKIRTTNIFTGRLSPNNFPNLGRPRLDAARFLKAGVPSLSFYTFGSTSYYHVPWDNLDIIKPEILEDMAQLMFLSVVELANTPDNIR